MSERNRRYDEHPYSRCLIVNADDFGLSAGVNAGIIKTCDHGIVTSASLMVRANAAQEAADLASQRPKLSVGLHVDLGEWMYRDSGWQLIDFVVEVSDAAEVQREVDRQIQVFKKLMGCEPTHLDSHQHVHRQQPVCGILERLARQLDVPLRHFSKEVTYRGDFYGQTAAGLSHPDAITPTGLLKVLGDLPIGITELACHPGEDDQLETMYARERVHEVETLCSVEIQEAIDRHDIRMISFHDVRRLTESKSAFAQCH
jgi:chitin disaccharide deacetylase